MMTYQINDEFIIDELIIIIIDENISNMNLIDFNGDFISKINLIDFNDFVIQFQLYPSINLWINSSSI